MANIQEIQGQGSENQSTLILSLSVSLSKLLVTNPAAQMVGETPLCCWKSGKEPCTGEMVDSGAEVISEEEEFGLELLTTTKTMMMMIGRQHCPRVPLPSTLEHELRLKLSEMAPSILSFHNQSLS